MQDCIGIKSVTEKEPEATEKSVIRIAESPLYSRCLNCFLSASIDQKPPFSSIKEENKDGWSNLQGQYQSIVPSLSAIAHVLLSLIIARSLIEGCLIACMPVNNSFNKFPINQLIFCCYLIAFSGSSIPQVQ